MSSIPEAVAAIRRGQMVILVDDEDRENEGDLVMAAELVTPEAINFMAKHARGLICLTLTEERLAALDIPMMVATNTAALGTAFTVSIEAKAGVSTGISAADRSHTIRVAMEEATRPSDLARPGHVFPLRARRGGVLVRTGQTEGSVDLARMAGCKPGGVICEIMNDDGSMARRSDLEIFAKQHGLLIVTIAELIEYRLEHDRLVKRVDSARIDHPRWGELTAHVYTTEIDNDEHLALIFGKLTGSVLVRVQSGPRAWFDGIMSNGQARSIAWRKKVREFSSAFRMVEAAARCHRLFWRCAARMRSRYQCRCVSSASARRYCAISRSRASACCRIIRGACPGSVASGSSSRKRYRLQLWKNPR